MTFDPTAGLPTREEKYILQAEYDRNRKDAVDPMNKYECSWGHVSITTGSYDKCPSCGRPVKKKN